MVKKALFLGSITLGAGFALTRLMFAKPPLEKTGASETSYDAIDRYIEQQMSRLHIPGASLAIVEFDRIVYMRGFGMARPGGELPTPTTPFFIGSITKAFTALAVMQLVEAGKVELDAPVQRYLPWFRVANPEFSAQMTVRHLLNQTSGLPMLESELPILGFTEVPDALERHVRALATLKTKPVGVKCDYSNFNYNILGLIVEVVSGERYADYIQKHIFDPLDMRHSYATKVAAQEDGLAVGHRHWFSLPFPAPNMPIPIGALPSGYLISCAEDLGHFLVAQLNGGHYGDAQVLSAAGIDEMHRGVLELGSGDFSAGFYGMGWLETDLAGEKIFSHGGNLPDFSAFMALVPRQKRAVVVLFNADPYGLPFVTDEIGMGVTALLAGQQPHPIKLDFIQWVMRLLPLLPLLQLISVFTTLVMLKRWQKMPSQRLEAAQRWRRRALLPLIPDLFLSGLLAFLHFSKVLRFMDMFMPDVALVSRMSGGLAAVRAFVRAGWVLRQLRKPRL